jgi:hypothetical protein
MITNNDKKNPKWESCCLLKSINDESALIMMCGKNEEHQPSVIAHWRIVIACAHCKAMDTHCQ